MTYDDHMYHDVADAYGCGKHAPDCWCGDTFPDGQCVCLSGRAGMAVAYRKVADRLTEHSPKRYACCGIPLDETGRCQHRSHHATPFHPTVESGRVYLPDLPEKPQVNS